MGILRLVCSLCLRLYRMAYVFTVRALISLVSVAGLYVVALVALFFFQNAHAARTIIVEPSQLHRTYTPGSSGFAFSDSRSWNADVGTQRGSKASVPVLKKASTGWPKFGAGMKDLLKINPARAAATTAFGAAMLGLDWVMTDGAISKRTGADEPVAGGFYWELDSAYNGSKLPALTPSGVCSQIVWDNNYKPTHVQMLNSTQFTCHAKRDSDGYTAAKSGRRYGASCPTGTTYNAVSGGCFGIGTLVPVTDSDIDQWLSAYNDPTGAADLAPHIAAEIPGSFDYPDEIVFTGPPSLELPKETTISTDPVTGDTTVTEILPSIQLEYGTQPLSVTATPTEVKNEFKNGQLTNTSTTTSTSTSTTTTEQLAIPTDCEFMPTVCAFIDWVKQPFEEPEPDFSEIMNDDEDFLREVVFNSNASCPAPLNISTALGDFDFSFDPACTFAGMFKPLFLSLCLLAAIYITLGAIRGGE